MIDITERLERLYVENGTNYVQEAAREIRNLRAEVATLRAEVANLTKIIDEAWGEA